MAQNRYLVDLREFQFVLFEQFKLGEILKAPCYQHIDEETAHHIITESASFVAEVLGPLNEVGDKQGCRVEGGAVKTPDGYKDAWTKLYAAGWKTISSPEEFGGQGAPLMLNAALEELISGSNTAFNMYPGLAMGAAEVIHEFASAEQKQRYLHGIYHGRYGGTMCLTEPHAGSDVGAARSKALRQADGTYLISGTKIFISGGDHDLAENVIHLVLARVEGAPPGTKGLSLFIVPKYRMNPDGSPGVFNDITVAGIEHKMGINGSATCVLNFGDAGGCVGEIVGGTLASENQGMRQMFQLMNAARIAVGLQGLGVASSAYLNALRYARERKQGPSIRHFKDPVAPRVPILDHADVRRMLLDMKARTEGIRAMVVKGAYHTDQARIAKGKDDAAHSYHQGQVELLTPLIKAYSSDQAFRVCETAIQTLGGAGYLKDYGLEQYCRDAKIFSIYEGTNHIQAMDLVGRKLGMAGGMYLQRYLADIAAFCQTHHNHPVLKSAIGTLTRATEALTGTTMRLLGWFQGGQLSRVPLNANRYLEMMAETTLGWLLLDQATIALAKLDELPADHVDRAFYQGKKYAALYFAGNILPGVEAKAQLIGIDDTSALDIPDAAFSTI